MHEEAKSQPLRRASDFAQQPCIPCKHDTDIALLKEKDSQILDALDRLETQINKLVEHTSEVPLFEERLANVLVKISASVETLSNVDNRLAATETKLDRFKLQIVTIWSVVAFLLPALGTGFVWSINSASQFRSDTERSIKELAAEVQSLRQLEAYQPPKSRK
jgi:DNA repair ATPase RecN